MPEKQHVCDAVARGYSRRCRPLRCRVLATATGVHQQHGFVNYSTVIRRLQHAIQLTSELRCAVVLLVLSAHHGHRPPRGSSRSYPRNGTCYAYYSGGTDAAQRRGRAPEQRRVSVDRTPRLHFSWHPRTAPGYSAVK